jgi:response regulator RpfG family c-di-GMP phosphodiesterase
VGSLGQEDGSGEPILSILRASYRVTLAETDAEALALLRAGCSPPVDLVVKEHEPPASDAAKFIAKLAKIAGARHMPVVGACVCMHALPGGVAARRAGATSDEWHPGANSCVQHG